MNKSIVLPVVAIALSLGEAAVAQQRASSFGPRKGNPKAVFVMTNAADRNQILSYQRQTDGTLTPAGTFRTGGRGSGGTTDPLGSQGSLVLSQDHSVLLAVNAGSGDISSFLVDGTDLQLADVQPSGGSAPVAVAQWGNWVYVLNFAGSSNVVGFKLDDGSLKPIPKSIRYLTSANSGASSIAFSPDGHFLAVAEKLNNNIDVFPVQPNGTLGIPVITKDAFAGLFDIAFGPDGTLYSLAAGAGTLSSYLVNAGGTLTSLSAGNRTTGAASCWDAVTPDGRFVYTSNAGSGNISGFSITGTGVLTALPGTVVASYPAGSTNLDIAISGDGKFLYTLNSGTGAIGMFSIKANGTLKPLGSLGGLPVAAGINGIAAL